MGGKSGQRYFGGAQLRFFGDGCMWVLVVLVQLSMEAKNYFVRFLFLFQNHERNITGKPIDIYVTKMQTKKFLPALARDNQFVLVRPECD